MDLHLGGIQLDPLGSPRDRVMRQHMQQRQISEVQKLMALMSASLGNADKSKEFLKQYTDGLWGTSATKEDRYREMQEYYTSQVKGLAPTLKSVKDSDGERLTVSGLEGLS